MKRIYLNTSTLILFLSFMVIVPSNICLAQSNNQVRNVALEIQEFSFVHDPLEHLDFMVDTWSSAVTKDEVSQITSIMDFWSETERAKYKLEDFKEVWVVNLKDYPDWQRDLSEIEPEHKAFSPTTAYTKGQLDIISNAQYNDHLRFSARFKSTRLSTGRVEENVLISQSMSLVPDVQASYKGGSDALIEYLKKKSKDHVVHLNREDVGRCRIFFTVSNVGNIKDVKLIESSKHPDVDQVLLNIVKEMPQKWKPAQTEDGEKVDQEFVFTFGMAGC